MKKVLLALSVMLFGVATVAAAGEEFSEVEYYRKLAEKQLAEAQAKAEPEAPVAKAEVVVTGEPSAPEATVVYLPPPIPELCEPAYQYKEVYEYLECELEPAAPKNVIVATTQYFHSKSDDGAKFKVDGTRLKSSKGKANGMGFTLAYNRRFNDILSVAFMYEYAFLRVHSGIAVPEDFAFEAKENSRYNSHVIGIIPEFNFGEWGRFQPSIIQGFDRASGTETINGVTTDMKDRGDGTNVTSLMAWYEKDFDFEQGFKLSPYAGWRSLYVKIKPTHEHEWLHLVSAGLKFSYQKNGLGFNLRGGINHRTTKDDLPGYGNRAVAPGVVMFSHRANMDRTIGTFGAGVNFPIAKNALASVNYDGFIGKNTSAHTATLSLIFPF